VELTFPIAALIVVCLVAVARRSREHSTVLATAEQCSHSIKALSTPTPLPKASRLLVGKRLGGDVARRTEPN